MSFTSRCQTALASTIVATLLGLAFAVAVVTLVLILGRFEIAKHTCDISLKHYENLQEEKPAAKETIGKTYLIGAVKVSK